MRLLFDFLEVARLQKRHGDVDFPPQNKYENGQERDAKPLSFIITRLENATTHVGLTDNTFLTR